MPPDVTVSDLAQDVLDTITGAFASAGVTLPARQYTHHGSVAIDRDQLVVTLSRGPYLGLPQAESQDAYQMFTALSVDFTVWLIRCVPADELPSMEELSSVSVELMTDAKLAVKAVIDAYNAKTFVNHCSSMVIGPGIPYGPEGGYGGTQFDVKVQL